LNNATEAHNQEYAILRDYSSISWVVREKANAFNVRFILPDKGDGNGTTSTLEISQNGNVIDHMALTSHFAYAYLTYGHDEPSAEVFLFLFVFILRVGSRRLCTPEI
jgi:hypothetical protein